MVKCPILSETGTVWALGRNDATHSSSPCPRCQIADTLDSIAEFLMLPYVFAEDVLSEQVDEITSFLGM